jgi:hypothetical protein
MSSSQIFIASSADLPFAANGPVCAMPNPILIGASANAEFIGSEPETASALTAINA